MNLSIEVHGVDAAIAHLSPVALALALKVGYLAIGEEVRNIIATYPGSVRLPFVWKSAKQKRFFFAMRAGNLPYVRNSDAMSQRLGPSWTVQGDATGAVVGTRATYAPYVQNVTAQQPGHVATGWKTDEQTVAEIEASNVIDMIMRRAIVAALGAD